MALSTTGNLSEAKAAPKSETKGGAGGAAFKSISPARSPTKGGDFDVVKVSRIASIAIKPTGAGNGYSYRSSLGGGKKAFHKNESSPKKDKSKEKQIPEKKETYSSVVSKGKNEEKTESRTKQKSSGASTNEKTKSRQTTRSEHEKRSSSSSSSVGKKDSSKGDKTVRNRAIRELQEREEEEESSDEEIIPGNDPMDIVRVSPYEGNANAEKEVKLFEDLHSVLTEGSIKASKIFGEVNARIMVRAYNQIDQSGMVYSQEWVDGVMRGNHVGVLPKDLLLLCLISNRLTKVDEFLMAGLTRDLELIKIIKEAVEAWDLEDDYRKIAGTSGTLKNFTFSSKRRHCFKCEIFVARAYSCYKAFGSKGRVDKSLMAKVRKCLEIMESRVPQPKGKDSKKRKKSLEKPVVIEPPVVMEQPVKEDPPPPPKRKRGRPPKKIEVAAQTFEESDESVMDHDDDNMVEVPVEVAPRSSMGGAATSNNSNNSKKRAKKEPMSAIDIIAKFEEQYHGVGKMYLEMGKTLALLKSTIEEDQSNREQDIRDEVRGELVAEMQKRITKK